MLHTSQYYTYNKLAIALTSSLGYGDSALSVVLLAGLLLSLKLEKMFPSFLLNRLFTLPYNVIHTNQINQGKIY